MLGQRRDMPRQHAHIMDAPARCHAPAGARPGDLYREFGLVDLRDHQPIAWRIFERDVDLLAIDLDMLVADLHLVLGPADGDRSEEHTSELQSLMRISYAVFCLKKKKQNNN